MVYFSIHPNFDDPCGDSHTSKVYFSHLSAYLLHWLSIVVNTPSFQIFYFVSLFFVTLTTFWPNTAYKIQINHAIKFVPLLPTSKCFFEILQTTSSIPKLDDTFWEKIHPKIVEFLAFQCTFINNLPLLPFLIYHFQCTI